MDRQPGSQGRACPMDTWTPAASPRAGRPYPSPLASTPVQDPGETGITTALQNAPMETSMPDNARDPIFYYPDGRKRTFPLRKLDHLVAWYANKSDYEEKLGDEKCHKCRQVGSAKIVHLELNSSRDSGLPCFVQKKTAGKAIRCKSCVSNYCSFYTSRHVPSSSREPADSSPGAGSAPQNSSVDFQYLYQANGGLQALLTLARVEGVAPRFDPMIQKVIEDLAEFRRQFNG